MWWPGGGTPIKKVCGYALSDRPLFSRDNIDIASFFRPRQSLPVLFGDECPPGWWPHLEAIPLKQEFVCMIVQMSEMNNVIDKVFFIPQTGTLHLP